MDGGKTHVDEAVTRSVNLENEQFLKMKQPVKRLLSERLQLFEEYCSFRDKCKQSQSRLNIDALNI